MEICETCRYFTKNYHWDEGQEWCSKKGANGPILHIFDECDHYLAHMTCENCGNSIDCKDNLNFCSNYIEDTPLTLAAKRYKDEEQI